MNNDIINLKDRLFNSMLMVEPSYAQILFGALADKYNIQSLVDGDAKLSQGDLKDGAFSFSTDRSERKPYQVINGSAFIPVSGSLVAKTSHLRPFSGMTGYNAIKANLDMALDDGDVKSIIFDMDSSGGEVTGVFELSDYIHSKRGTKKMTSMVSNLSCSACYVLAAATDEIVLSETATVGSIGVITAHANLEKKLEKDGIEITLIHAGDHKKDGNPYEGLSTEVQGRIQDRLDTIYTMFTTRVAKYRGISVDAVIKTQALTYLGSSAIDVGLADKVVSTIEFVEELSQTSGVNINLENNMPKEHEEALVAATATGVKTGEKAGATAMQERIKGILACDEASGRETLANHLAFSTSMNVNECTVLLAASGKEAPITVVEENKPVTPVDAKVDSGLDKAMADNAADHVEADSNLDEPITAESNPVAFAKQSYKSIHG